MPPMITDGYAELLMYDSFLYGILLFTTWFGSTRSTRDFLMAISYLSSSGYFKALYDERSLPEQKDSRLCQLRSHFARSRNLSMTQLAFEVKAVLVADPRDDLHEQWQVQLSVDGRSLDINYAFRNLVLLLQILCPTTYLNMLRHHGFEVNERGTNQLSERAFRLLMLGISHSEDSWYDLVCDMYNHRRELGAAEWGANDDRLLDETLANTCLYNMGDWVRPMLAFYNDVNRSPPLQTPLLWVAIESKRIGLLSVLLESKAVDAKSFPPEIDTQWAQFTSLQPLQFAIFRLCPLEFIKTLCEAGAMHDCSIDDIHTYESILDLLSKGISRKNQSALSTSTLIANRLFGGQSKYLPELCAPTLIDYVYFKLSDLTKIKGHLCGPEPENIVTWNMEVSNFLKRWA